MATELISVGPVTVLTQNTVFALPASRCLLYTDNAATLVQSTTVGMAATTAVTLAGGQAEVCGGFIKLTSAGPINVLLKKA